MANSSLLLPSHSVSMQTEGTLTMIEKIHSAVVQGHHSDLDELLRGGYATGAAL